MNIGKYRTHVVLAMTVLWVAITLCGWFGKWYVGLFLSVLLMLLHMMLGAAQKGILSKKLLMYPFLTWGVVWSVGFYMAKMNSDAFMNIPPSYTILGFHPSFAWIVLCYWIGGVLTLTLGLVKYKDLWLSDTDWDAFITTVKHLNEGGK
jgi:hypothetical protein